MAVSLVTTEFVFPAHEGLAPASIPADSPPSPTRRVRNGPGRDSQAGFTLVELLVVMLILGVLAAIALPAFFQQKEKAGDSKAREYAHSAQVAMEAYSVDHRGSYEGASKAQLERIEPELASAIITVEEATANGYRIKSESTQGHEFSVARTAGVISFACAPKGRGGCPASGNWSE